MAADRAEPMRIELSAELFRREAIRAREFHIGETQFFDGVEGAWHIFGKLVAQAVKLKAYRTLKTRADTGRRSLCQG
jgi:hypothetical protein